jgi:hypothetical protein
MIYDTSDSKRKARAMKAAIEDSSRGGGLAGRTAATAPSKRSAAGRTKPARKAGLAGRTPLATSGAPKKKSAAGSMPRTAGPRVAESNKKNLRDTYAARREEMKKRPKRLPSAR